MREIKFRAFEDGRIVYPTGITLDVGENRSQNDNFILMQYTGLKDKNQPCKEVYEGDIIDVYGKIKGNTYEMDAGETDFIIQGFGDKNWGATYQEAMGRGCTDAQRYADTDEVRKLD